MVLNRLFESHQLASSVPFPDGPEDEASSLEAKTAVDVETITHDVRIYEVPRLEVCALGVSSLL